jgi:galactofuranose transport system ATP-binding protein
MNRTPEVPVLEARGVSRRFGARRALDDVAIRVEPSSIHAVLGKNGAGKSTLMKVIAGTDLPDRGELLIKGEPVASGGIRAHEAAGVVYVPQELTVFPGLSVADQILLGDRYPVSPLRTIRRRTGEMQAKATICQLDDGIDPAAPVTSLSLPQLRTVMIARALHLNAKVLVLDEPTEAFSADEVEVLFTLLRTLVSGGISILYVSHRLSEVFSLADTVTVLRDGKLVIAGQPVTEASADEVVAAIVNEPLDASSLTATQTPIAAHATPSEGDGDCLVFTPSPAPSSLTVRRGSVVGLAGLAGSGRTSIMNRLAGTVPLRAGDTLSVDGSRIDSGRKRLHAGVVLLPEDRAGLGLLPSLTVRENISIAGLKPLRNGWLPFLSRWRENRQVIQAMRAVGLDPTLLDSPVMLLSGGNQQKVLIARGIFADAKIWLLDEPTVGLDVQSRKQVLSLVRELALGDHIDGRPNPSTGAIVASSDLDDLIEACDIVYVVDQGTVGAALTAPFTEEELLHATAFSHTP